MLLYPFLFLRFQFSEEFQHALWLTGQMVTFFAINVNLLFHISVSFIIFNRVLVTIKFDRPFLPINKSLLVSVGFLLLSANKKLKENSYLHSFLFPFLFHLLKPLLMNGILEEKKNMQRWNEHLHICLSQGLHQWKKWGLNWARDKFCLSKSWCQWNWDFILGEQGLGSHFTCTGLWNFKAFDDTLVLQAGGRDSGIRLNILKNGELKSRKIDHECVWNKLGPLYLWLCGKKSICFTDLHFFTRITRLTRALDPSRAQWEFGGDGQLRFTRAARCGSWLLLNGLLPLGFLISLI